MNLDDEARQILDREARFRGAMQDEIARLEPEYRALYEEMAEATRRMGVEPIRLVHRSSSFRKTWLGLKETSQELLISDRAVIFERRTNAEGRSLEISVGLLTPDGVANHASLAESSPVAFGSPESLHPVSSADQLKVLRQRCVSYLASLGRPGD